MTAKGGIQPLTALEQSWNWDWKDIQRRKLKEAYERGKAETLAEVRKLLLDDRNSREDVLAKLKEMGAKP